MAPIDRDTATPQPETQFDKVLKYWTFINSILIVLASVFVYYHTHQAEKATLELKALQMKIDHTSLDLELKTKILNIESAPYLIEITLMAKNRGGRDIYLDMDGDKSPPITLIPVEVTKDRLMVKRKSIFTAWLQSYKQKNGKNYIFAPENKYVNAGSTKKMTFLAMVDQKGIYMIQFKAPMTRHQESLMQKTENENGVNTSPEASRNWKTETFVYITDKKECFK